MIAANFAAIFAALLAAHYVGDYWLQTDHQAQVKGCPGLWGWLANLAHVATYTAAGAVAIGAVVWRCELDVSLGKIAAGLAVSAITHAWADRRHTLAWLAGRLGQAGFYRLGSARPGRDDNPTMGTGAHALDQSWHLAWLFVAALVAA